MAESERNLNCLICSKPLEMQEILLNRSWHFACAKCAYCGSEDGIEQYSERVHECLLKGIPVSHQVCHKTALFAEFKQKVIPVTKFHIDLLNEQICSFFPAVNPDTSDVKLLYDLLISLQETATNVSYCLSLTKDKLLVKESRTFDTQQKVKRDVERAASLETESAKLERQKRSDMFKVERENPELRFRRKAIEGFIALGMSESVATEMVDKQAKGKTQ